MRLPNFFLAGVPKASTTSLYHYLGQHPRIYMSPIKEPNFFAAEIREENCDPRYRKILARQNRALGEFLAGPMREQRFGGIVANWDDYLRLFANADGETALGEASVCYFWSPTAPARIAEKIPGAKILVMLRHPAERAFSQYLHGVGTGMIRWSLREHIQRNLRQGSDQFSVDYPFLEFGMYSGPLARYRQHFGSNVWVGFHEDFSRSPAETLRNIFGFLGVAVDFPPDFSRRHLKAELPRLAAFGRLRNSRLWRMAVRATPASVRPLIRGVLMRRPEGFGMDPEDRRYLIDYYREDIDALAGMTGRDLDAWLR